ncbi:hypothetical protein PF008_g18764 [Phytophthora fragariae]|uniref:Uncharacterized protein n=1 Tax=Phytophthora fragariae TaxID=53985 RepID=A0A6G0R4C8_9STRA|nr:hypothetical protein PF008_g18764 [Phytophthora fragariae]
MNTTVRHTTTSPMAELSALLRTQLDRMLRCGTTPIDTKSGYGLDTDTELKVLRVLHAASTGDDAYPVKIPIPALVQAKEDGIISPELMDVFHEKGVFEHIGTHRVLEAGKKDGLKIYFHRDEMYPMQYATMAADLGTRAISHCKMLTLPISFLSTLSHLHM